MTSGIKGGHSIPWVVETDFPKPTMAISPPVVSRYSLLYPNGYAEAPKPKLFANIRGVEGPAIRKKISAIEASFPHSNNIPSSKLAQVYDAVLDLSKPKSHSMRVRHIAWRALLVQIGSRQTRYLHHSLTKRSSQDLRHFINEAITYMPEESTMPDVLRTPAHIDLMDDYLDSQSGESHPAMPFVDFVRQLVSSAPTTCSAVLEGGFLDMMFCIYAATIVPRTIYVGKSILPVRPITEEKTYMALLQSCSAALSVMFRTSIGAWSIERHPIHVLWPLIRPNPFTQLYTMLVDHPSDNKRRSIHMASRAHVLWRVLIPGPVFQKLSGQEGISELYDGCRFLRPEYFGAHLADWAIARYLTYITLDGRHYQALVTAIVDRSADYDGALEVFSRIIQALWHSLQAIESKAIPIHNSAPQAIDHFLEFAVAVIEGCPQKRGPDASLALYHAGILALWYAVAKHELKNPAEFRAVLQADLPTPTTPMKHTVLLQMISESGLEQFLTSGEMTHRRKVWSRLFKNLLNREVLSRT